MPLLHTARATRHLARLTGVIAMLLLVTGCSRGLYTTRLVAPAQPPGQSEGPTCLAHCDLLKTQCRQRQETRERACGDWYAAARKDYDLCRGGTAKGGCRAPDTCLGADMGICDQQYEGCFTACGGRVERQLRLGSGTQGAAAAPVPTAGQPAK